MNFSTFLSCLPYLAIGALAAIITLVLIEPTKPEEP
jgi:hypothetical protein